MHRTRFLCLFPSPISCSLTMFWTVPGTRTFKVDTFWCYTERTVYIWKGLYLERILLLEEEYTNENQKNSPKQLYIFILPDIWAWMKENEMSETNVKAINQRINVTDHAGPRRHECNLVFQIVTRWICNLLIKLHNKMKFFVTRW